MQQFDRLYWQNEFALTSTDMESLAATIQQSKRAYDLTGMARKLVNLRLLNKAASSSPLAKSKESKTKTVLWWDQVESVSVGDQLIVLHSNKLIVQSAEVTAVEFVPNGTRIHVFLPEKQKNTMYVKPSDAKSWEQIRNKYRERRFSSENADVIERILLEHGSYISERLLGALRADERFIRLSGRWFLMDAVQKPTEQDIAELAWFLARAQEPQLTQVLAEQVKLGDLDDSWLFGVYVALRQHSQLFQNTTSGPEPMWELCGSPPSSFIPRCAAYDPESYEILVEPQKEASQETAARLWELDLLKAVI